MSVSSVSPSTVYTAPTTQPVDPVDTAADTSNADDDYSSYWTQFEKDCCDDTMNSVNQAQAEEKKNDQEVYHQDG